MKNKKRQKKIVVVGLGYIGLPTATLFADAGFDVCGVDIDIKKIQKLKKGILPFEEPGLDKLFAKARGNMVFSEKMVSGDVFIVAVPTPLDPKRKRSDLSFVRSACERVSTVLKEGDMVILESTVPPGTASKLCDPIFKKRVTSYHLVHAPERAFPQKTLVEMVKNDRVIGGATQESAEYARELYKSFVRARIFLTDITTAEFVKVLENSFRDINIAFANEVARICEGIGVDAWEVIELANKHPRVNILKPGPGVGGHCIAVDPWFLLEGGVTSQFVVLAREINDGAPKRVVDLVMKSIKNISNPKVGVLGVAYKRNVGDSRETPATPIIEGLLKKNLEVKITDPYVKDFGQKLDPLHRVLRESDCVVLVTDHDVYGSIDLKKYKNIRVIIDTRNFFKNIPNNIQYFKTGKSF